jgi:hypothetical protein
LKYLNRWLNFTFWGFKPRILNFETRKQWYFQK